MASYYTFEDHSGTPIPVTGDNPYQDLIAACQDDPTKIQERYNTHRVNRNNQQKDKLLSQDFPGVTVDQILAKLEDPSIEPGFEDPRHCLVFWARPPAAVKSLIAGIQEKLLQVAPSLWTMPQDSLHMTAMEVTHSLTAPDIEVLIQKLLHSVPAITDYTLDHRARLMKPMVSFDAQALALSFLPAVGESHRPLEEDRYSYHHLRRDLFDKIQATGAQIASRYVIPSAHLTIGRFITKKDFETAEGTTDHDKVRKLVGTIEEINDWLQAEYWPKGGGITDGGEWIVGQEKGLEFRKGRLWYGGGEHIRRGRGF